MRDRATARGTLRWLYRVLASFCGIGLTGFFLPGHLNRALGSSDGTINRFTPATVALNSLHLFDIGVTDVNADGRLDIFTSNHSGAQSLLLGEADANFKDVFSAWRLDQNPEFVGFDVPSQHPEISEPGLYIYRQDGQLVLRMHSSEETVASEGRVYLPVETEVRESDGIKVEITTGTPSSGESPVAIRFTATGDGSLVLRPKYVAVPISLRLSPELPLDRVYVGQKKVRPRSHEFTLTLRDRHGMAWADWNADGRKDVFIVRGGLQGNFSQAPAGLLSNELLCNAGARFNNCTLQVGISGVCRGREVEWVDFDGDGRLDLHIGCRNGPNQLYRSTANERFHDVAPELGLDSVESSAGKWLDSDGDGDMDLFLVERSGYRLYVNESGSFRPTLACRAGATRLTVADFDRDGDPDIYAVGRRRSVLLENAAGSFRCVNPSLIGLPAAGRTANWVDFDNDGLMDLHVVPGGLYRQLPGGRFTRGPSLEPAGYDWRDVRGTWFDADNDGDRDLLMAVRRKKTQWDVTLHRNSGSANHWLELDLVGSGGNREAIGARVMAIAGGGVQVQHVGHAEGAYFSRGHYRVYFGLGSHERVDMLRIWWPNGQIQELTNLTADRVLRVEQNWTGMQ
jgi:hypothetical protein